MPIVDEHHETVCMLQKIERSPTEKILNAVL